MGAGERERERERGGGIVRTVAAELEVEAFEGVGHVAVTEGDVPHHRRPDRPWRQTRINTCTYIDTYTYLQSVWTSLELRNRRVILGGGSR